MKNYSLPFAFTLINMLLSSCVKDKFDAPPVNCADPNGVNSTMTIADLKALYSGIGFLKLTSDDIIEGIIIADDRSGNFYKNIVIQDETAGIAILIDGSSLYTEYPIGRKIFIHIKDLYLGNYNGLVQLGYNVDYSGTSPALTEIQISIADKFITKGSCNNLIVPIHLPISTLNNAASLTAYQNKLIQLDSVEFSSSSLGQTYADAIGLASRNLTVEDCTGSTITLRTSGYADFARDTIPSGKGILLGVYQIYGTTPQLYIRNTNDVNMLDTRCGGGGTATLHDIIEVRSVYTGTTVSAPSGWKIKGIVTSDKNYLNTDAKNIVIQDATAGIVVRFISAHSYNIGDEIEVNIDAQELSEYNGLLQINNCPNANATLLSTSNVVTPQTVTVAEINTAPDNYESELIELSGVTLSSGTGATIYGGSLNCTQGANTIILYTRSAATFSATTYPTGILSSIVAIVSDFDGPQIIIRSTADVSP